jgi:hypothetical protein
MRLCWITGRNTGVKHFLLEPGLTTEESIQRQMIQDLKNRQVAWIILKNNRIGDSDFETRKYRGATVLDQFLIRNYEPVQELGGFSILKRGR